MASLLGHCHPEVTASIRAASETIDHISSCMLSPPVLTLANKLTSLLPTGLDKAVFYSTGSESNEAAIRLAKIVTGRFEIVGLGQSWHGMSAGAQGAQYNAGRRGHGNILNNLARQVSIGIRSLTPLTGPLIPGQHMLPQPNAYRSIFRHPDGSHDWETELNYGWALIDQASCGSLAACLVECIQGDGGIHVLPPGYLSALKTHCEARGMLLIVDEAQTALGRTGALFAFEHHDVIPDILTLSKPLANGLPLSAMVTSTSLDAAGRRHGFLFFTTHTNDPLVAAVGNTVLDIVVRDDLATNAKARGEQLLAGLHHLQKRYSFIGDVRGCGLMAGIEIVRGSGSKEHDPELASQLSASLWRAGLWCQLQSRAVFRIGPRINCEAEEIVRGLEIFERVFEGVSSVRANCSG
jgi:4-aminobutyrate aminotransferase-like enzyme